MAINVALMIKAKFENKLNFEVTEPQDLTNDYSAEFSKLVDMLHKLPGVGKRTALRYALDVIKWDRDEQVAFGNILEHLKERLHYCKSCYNLSDTEICNICNNPSRNKNEICVVHDIRDVMAIEATTRYKGLYHVLGGKISPMDGIGPQELRIDELEDRIKNQDDIEVILALSTDMEGETTAYYLYKKLATYNVKFSTIARGVALGDELEYTDENTLGNSIVNRVPYQYEKA